MGREIRKVPAEWEHPRYTPEDAPSPTSVGKYQPQFEETFQNRISEDPDFADEDPSSSRPEEMAGGTHFQLYENTTEGTPISPVFPDVQQLAKHLLEHGDDRNTTWPHAAVRQITEQGYLLTSQAMAYDV